MFSLFPLYFSVYMSMSASLYHYHLSLLLFGRLWVYFSLCCFLLIFHLTHLSFSSLYTSLTYSLSPGFFFQLSLLFQLGKDWESYLYTVLYLTSSVTTANSQTSCISNSSLVKEDRNPLSTSFPELLWEGYSGVATAVLVAVIVETSYLSGTLYPSLHYPQDIPFGGFVLLHSTIFPKRRLRRHRVIWLTQHYRTESLFKPMFLPWYMHKILIIMWLIKLIGKYTVPLQWQLYLNSDS